VAGGVDDRAGGIELLDVLEMPMKIKILSYVGDYDSNDDYIHILRGVTDWEEVDADTYHKLAGWCAMKNRATSMADVRYTIFRQDQINVMSCVQEYLDHMAAEEKKRAAAAKKRLENKRLKLAKKQKLAEDQERKLLQDLKQKYGE
jgi:hypothetical protein